MQQNLESIPSRRVKAIKEEIRGIIQSNLSPSQVFLIQSHLNMIDSITKQIAEIDAKISGLISSHKRRFKDRLIDARNRHNFCICYTGRDWRCQRVQFSG